MHCHSCWGETGNHAVLREFLSLQLEARLKARLTFLPLSLIMSFSDHMWLKSI